MKLTKRLLKRLEILKKQIFDLIEDVPYHIRKDIKEMTKDFSLENIHYIPASRSKFMITYETLLSADRYIHRHNRGNGLAEVDSNFLDDINSLNNADKSTFYDIATLIEDNILSGNKLRIAFSSLQPPEFTYVLKDSDTELDLKASSSSVTELSAFIIYFRYYLKKGDTLIIDEPELSLHPEAQKELVNILVKAVNMGVKIILVTHSPYIIEAVNNSIQKHRIKDMDIENRDIKVIEPISRDNISSYLFEDETIKDIQSQGGFIDNKFLESFYNNNDISKEMFKIQKKNSSNS